jgi:hypothetical protein
MRELRARLRQARPLLLAGDGLWDLTSHERHDDLAAWCATHEGQRCVLWVGGAYLADLVCEPGLPLDGKQARMDWARRVFVHYHGTAASTWALLPWQRRAARGVSALHGLDLATMRERAAERRVQIVAVHPLWPVVLERLLAQRPALRTAAQARALLLEHRGDSHGAVLTTVSLQQGRVRAVHRRRLDALVLDGLQAVLREDADAQGQPAAAWLLDLQGLQGLPMAVLDVAGNTPSPFDKSLLRGATAAPDFLQPLPRAGAVVWGGLAVSLLVLGLAGLDAHAAWLARNEALALVVPRAVPAALKAIAFNPADAALQQRLAHPWREVFLASELPAGGGLIWLNMEHQIGGDLRLQGVAPAAEPVQRAAAALRSRPVWRQVLVSRLETEAQGLSFEIVARPVEAAP